MRLYRVAALVLAAGFLLVGALFLALPDEVLSFFNRLSGPLGMPEMPHAGHTFFLALGSGYMYLVSLLAWRMFRQPDSRTFPSLLIQAKLATSLLSLGFFLAHRPYLIYLVNFFVDGLIAWGVCLISRPGRRESR